MDFTKRRYIAFFTEISGWIYDKHELRLREAFGGHFSKFFGYASGMKSGRPLETVAFPSTLSFSEITSLAIENKARGKATALQSGDLLFNLSVTDTRGAHAGLVILPTNWKKADPVWSFVPPKFES